MMAKTDDEFNWQLFLQLMREGMTSPDVLRSMRDKPIKPKLPSSRPSHHVGSLNVPFHYPMDGETEYRYGSPVILSAGELGSMIDIGEGLTDDTELFGAESELSLEKEIRSFIVVMIAFGLLKVSKVNASIALMVIKIVLIR